MYLNVPSPVFRRFILRSFINTYTICIHRERVRGYFLILYLHNMYQEKRGGNNKIPRSRNLCFLILFISMIVSIAVLLNPNSLTGLATYEETHVLTIDAVLEQETPLLLGIENSLTALRTSGNATGIGNFSVVLVDDANEYVIVEGILEENQTQEFVQACKETCTLSNVSKNSAVKLYGNVTLSLKELAYKAQLEKEEVTWNVSKETWKVQQDKNLTLNLSLFILPKSAEVTFSTTQTGRIAFDLKQNVLTIIPEPDFVGRRVVTLLASDGTSIARKEINIEVIASEKKILNLSIDEAVIQTLNQKSMMDVIVILKQKNTSVRTNQKLIQSKSEIKKMREALLDNLTSPRQGRYLADEFDYNLTRAYEMFPVIAGTLTKAGLEKLKQSDVVEYIIPDNLLSVAREESLQLINAPAKTRKDGGHGLTTCMLDTGIDKTHPELTNSTLSGYNFVNDTSDTSDDAVNSHGTHMAGIVHAVAPNATLLPIKVCNEAGKCKLSALLAGIDYCMNQTTYNITTISASITDGGAYNNGTCPTFLNSVLSDIAEKNITFITPSGNDGQTTGISYPACSPYTIAVGATTKQNTIASFTNRGDLLDILAPGVDITSTIRGGGYGNLTGTSAPVPFVAGAVILRAQRKGKQSLPTIQAALKESGKLVENYKLLNVNKFIRITPENVTILPPLNNTYVRVEFKQPTDITQFEMCSNLSYNHAEINTSACPELNQSARIWFYNLPYIADLQAFKDNKTCTTCENITLNGSHLFMDVIDFSTYSLNGSTTTFKTASTCGTISASTTLDSNVSASGTCFTISASNVVLDCAGFTIAYANGQSISTGVSVSSLNNITVKNCFIINGTQGSGSPAIQFSTVENSTIFNNTINLTVFDSMGLATGIGIDVSGASANVNITNNNVTVWNDVGISITATGSGTPGAPTLNTITLINNTVFSNSSAAISVGTSSTLVGFQNLTNNKAKSTFSRGIYVKGSNNSFENNTAESEVLEGIFIDLGNNNTFINTTIISQNGTALKLDSDVHNNTFIDTKLATNGTWIIVDSVGGLTPSLENNMTWTRFDEPNGSILIIPHITLNGSVEFADSVSNVSKQKINVTFNNAFLNSSQGHTRMFNRTGEVTLRNITFSNPQPEVTYYDNNSWESCASPTCVELSFASNVFVFNVSSFTTYRANETPVTNSAPVINTFIFNATNANNNTRQNLTVYITNVSDADNNRVQNITDWRRNESSIAFVNMPFENLTSGTTTGQIRDYSQYGNNGTLGGGTAGNAPVWIAGQVGGAYDFDGLNDFINISHHGSQNVKDSFSIEAWFKRDGGCTGNCLILMKQNASTGGEAQLRYDLEWLTGNGLLGMSLNTGSWGGAVTSTAALSNDVWYHAIATYDGATARLYINGVLNNSAAKTGDVLQSTGGEIRIGSESAAASEFFNGTIDEVRIYNRTLTAAQINQLYLDGNTSKHPQTIVQQELTRGDIWSVAIVANDNATDSGLNITNNVTIINTAPVLNTQALTASNANNNTQQNITISVTNVTDADDERVRNITDWRRNQTSIAFLNIPFETNSSSLSTGDIRDYSQYGNNGTRGGGASGNAPLWVAGQVGGAYDFDGINDFINISHHGSQNVKDQLTIEAWFRRDGGCTGNCIIVLKQNATGAASANLRYGLVSFSSSKDVSLELNTGTWGTAVNLTAPLADNTWYHVVATYNGSIARMYVNGVLNNTAAKTGDVLQSTQGMIQIGSQTGQGAEYFNGTIDEVRIYNRTLTAAQINQLYVDGTNNLHPQTIHNQTVYAGDIWSVAVTPNDNITDGTMVISNNVTMRSNSLPVVNTVILNATNANNNTAQNLTLFVTNVTDADDERVQNITDWRRNETSIAFLNMPFETNTIGVALGEIHDYSQYGNNGTLGGEAAASAPSWIQSGKVGGAYKFDGTNDFINMSNHGSFSVQDRFTIEAWVNQSGTCTSNCIVVMRQNSSSGGSNQLMYGLVWFGTANAPSFSFNTEDTGWADVVNTTAPLSDNVWYHIVGTYNGSIASIYVNGVLNNTAAKTGKVDFANAGTLDIGRETAASSEYFAGSIDEVRIYNRSLTAAQINQLYLDGNNSKHPETIHNETVYAGDIWSVAVTSNDNTTDGATVISDNVTVRYNTPPVVNTIILNATNANNNTAQNLTVFVTNVTDADNDRVQNITDWRRNQTSIAVLNMPFETNITGTATGAIRDYSQYGNNGTLGNETAGTAPTWNSSGRVGGAYIFDGNDRLNSTDISPINTPAVMTISVWINPRGPTNIPRQIIAKYNSSTDDGWMFRLSSSDELEFDIRGSSFEAYRSAIGIVPTNRFTHVAVVYNLSETNKAKLYVNGTEISVTKVGSSTQTSSTPTPVTIGFIPVDGQFFNGTIDEVLILNKTVSAQQIAQIYNDTASDRHLTTIVSQELTAGDIWSVAVIANDNITDSTMNLSNNLTVASANTGPTITRVWAPGSLTPQENARTGFNITINFTANDVDGTGDLSNASAVAYIINNSVIKRSSPVNCSAITVNATAINYSCQINISHYLAAGVWNITVNITDAAGVMATNASTTFTLNALTALVLNTSGVVWNEVRVGAGNQRSNVSLGIDNTGNVNITGLNFTAFDVWNATAKNFVISAANFTVSVHELPTGPPATLSNNTLVALSNSTIDIDSDSSDAGNRTFYFFINVSHLIPGRYNATKLWEVSLT